MRDPKRIKPTLEILERIWTANPDLRLGQIIVGAAQASWYSSDVFYLEDDKMRKTLLRYEELTKETEDPEIRISCTCCGEGSGFGERLLSDMKIMDKIDLLYAEDEEDEDSNS